jgi:protein phosphatase
VTTPDHTEILVHVFGRTDVGRTREHNEDAFVIADLTRNDASLQPSVRTHRVGAKGTLFMVADGMGGAAAGEIASQMATEIVLKELREHWVNQESGSTEAFARCIKQATQKANALIHGYATSHQEYRGMGTTATIAGLLADTLYLAQVGDSRGYLIRDGVAKQITKDQSLMQKLIEAGELTEEEAAQSERRNIILQALGPESTIKVDLTFQRLRRGDSLLLCSDGLSGQVTKDQIAQVVSEEKDLVQACRRLIDYANAAGGPDNITVIIARFDGEGLNEYGEGDEVGHRVFSLNDGGVTPPIGIERVQDVTAPVRVANRSTLPVDTQLPTTEEIVTADIGEGLRADPPAGVDVDATTEPTIETLDAQKLAAMRGSEGGRKSRGVAIAIALLALLIAFAAWYAFQTVKKVQPEQTPPPPAAPPATP